MISVASLLFVQLFSLDRVKLGKFGHQVSSDTHLQTVTVNPDETAPYEPSHQHFDSLFS